MLNVSLLLFYTPTIISLHQAPSYTPSTPNIMSDALANKSSLFNKTQAVGTIAQPSAVLNPPKVINHGKPNLAPKPPLLKIAVASSNGNGNNSNNIDSNNISTSDNSRKSVARHQSMKTPRYNTNNKAINSYFDKINF